MSEPAPTGPRAGAHGLRRPPAATTPPVLRPAGRLRGPESLGGLLLILAGIAGRGRACCWTGWPPTTVSGWGLRAATAFDDLGERLAPTRALAAAGDRARRRRAVPARPADVAAGALAPLPRRPGAAGQPRRHRGRARPAGRRDVEPRLFGPGFWCAIAVAVLGLLGSLKALLTAAAEGDRLSRRRARRGRGRTAPRAPGRSARR